jgi:hypothetical protein
VHASFGASIARYVQFGDPRDYLVRWGFAPAEAYLEGVTSTLELRCAEVENEGPSHSLETEGNRCLPNDVIVSRR